MQLKDIEHMQESRPMTLIKTRRKFDLTKSENATNADSEQKRS